MNLTGISAMLNLTSQRFALMWAKEHLPEENYQETDSIPHFWESLDRILQGFGQHVVGSDATMDGAERK